MDRRLHHLSRHFVIHSSDEINCNLKNFGFFKSTTLFNLQWKEKNARKLLFCFPTVLHRWYISPENACKGLKMKRSCFLRNSLVFSLAYLEFFSFRNELLDLRQTVIYSPSSFPFHLGFSRRLGEKWDENASSEKTKMSRWHCHTKMN